ncbi:hypothetical protein F5Y03DRAFT_380680 [Xylaria venustula]|nr:hypothetical protein F5Y03DRAFT_380680 [Xylaria venustula]
MANYNCLQDLLKAQAESGSIKCYPLGDTTEPLFITYEDLFIQSRQNSAKICEIPGFKEKQPVLLYFATHMDNIIWFWSVLFADGIPVILAPSNVNNDHLSKLAELMESPICITTDDFTHLFSVGRGLKLHTVDDVQQYMPSSVPTSYFRYEGDSATAVLMLTSGSTGTPKAVSLSHGQVLAAVAGKATVRPLLPGNFPLFNWIGLDHVASLIEIHIQALWLGVDQVHAHAADIVSSPTTFMSLLHRHKVSRTFALAFRWGKAHRRAYRISCR